MCGRFTIMADPEEVQEMMPDLKIAEWPGPRYNVAPTQSIPTVLNDEELVVTVTHWGLIPSWAKERSIANKMINARGETLLEKPAFKAAFKRRRCVIIGDGFFEWKKIKGKKIPHHVRLKSRKPFAFAGLWEVWKDPETEEKIKSSTIITTSPNEVVKDIHNRMPAILRPEDYERWLEPEEIDPEPLLETLKPYPAEEMEAVPVSPAVNNPKNEGEELLYPLEKQNPQSDLFSS